jgi:hemoglobin/transferrin/lactoferrin receptor protein
MGFGAVATEALARARGMTGRLLATTALVGFALPYMLAAPVSLAQGVVAVAERGFDIPAQPLAGALRTFGQQAGMQVTVAATTTQGVTSRPVSGVLTPQAALAMLLGGTGIPFSISADGTALVGQPAAAETGGYDGSIMLDTIDVVAWVEAAGAAGARIPFTPDTPYLSAGSVSHVSSEQINRVPPTTAGDLLVNVPGVISSGNHITPSVNPNIRGLQSMGRVVTTVDGARQTTSVYRGYIGSRDETYIDPDLIGGVDVTKGPGGGTGGIGGSVTFRTVNATDIIRDGNSFGVRVRTSVGNNTANAYSLPLDISFASPVRPEWVRERPDFLEGSTWSGSVVGAATVGNFSFLGAYARRQQGNYFAGNNVSSDGIIFYDGTNSLAANASRMPGTEIFNTSQDVTSVLLKADYDSGDGLAAEVSFQRYHNIHGETSELLSNISGPGGQRAFQETQVDTYTARLRYNPVDNELVDLRANVFYTDLVRGISTLNYPAAQLAFLSDDLRSNTIATMGGDIRNTSRFDTGFGDAAITIGADYVHEHAWAPQTEVRAGNGNFIRWDSFDPSGVRVLAGAQIDGSWEPTDWLTLNAGLRYDWYEARGEGYLAEFADKSGSGLSPNVGATITPFEGLQLFALYKEGMRAPSLREAYWTYSNVISHNPDLGPEYAQSWEIGANLLRDDVLFWGDTLRFKAAYFDNRYNDYIFRVGTRGVGSGQPYHWSNLHHANYRGIELSGGYDAGAFFIEGAYTRFTDVQYCVSEDVCASPKVDSGFGSSPDDPLGTDYANNYVSPEYSGSLTAGVRFLDQRLTVGGRVHFAGVRFGASPPTSASPTASGTAFPGYTTYDAFASFEVNDHVDLNLSIENLTDEYYFGALATTNLPSPGRTARLTLTGSF